jgi:hypothetical protein
MNDYVCDRCTGPAPRGSAFVRSLGFRQVAWCADCWKAMHTDRFVPGQRTGQDAGQGTARPGRRWYSRR